MGKIIGIDLGTTNSLVSVFRDGEAEVIPNALGEALTPSVVGVDESDESEMQQKVQEVVAPDADQDLARRARENPNLGRLLDGLDGAWDGFCSTANPPDPENPEWFLRGLQARLGPRLPPEARWDSVWWGVARGERASRPRRPSRCAS